MTKRLLNIWINIDVDTDAERRRFASFLPWSKIQTSYKLKICSMVIFSNKNMISTSREICLMQNMHAVVYNAISKQVNKNFDQMINSNAQ